MTALPASFFCGHIQAPDQNWGPGAGTRLPPHFSFPMTSERMLGLWNPACWWGNIHTADNTFNWTPFDAWMTGLANRGTQPLICLHSPAAWMGTTGGKPNPSGAAAAQFATAIINRYPSVDFTWEGYNEFNASPDAYNGSYGTDLVNLQSAFYNAIKDLRPSQIVCSPTSISMNGNHIDFSTFLTGGGGAYFDVAAFHSYPILDTTQLPALIDRMTAALSEASVTGKPLWMTEGSCAPTNFDNNTDADTQQAYAATFTLFHWMKNVERQYWYAWDNNPAVDLIYLWSQSSVDVLGNFGLGLKGVHDWIIGASIATPFADNSGVWSGVITLNDSRQGIPVWKPSGTGVFVNPDVSLYTEVIDLAGGSTPAGATVNIGPKPVMLAGVPLDNKIYDPLLSW